MAVLWDWNLAISMATALVLVWVLDSVQVLVKGLAPVWAAAWVQALDALMVMVSARKLERVSASM